MIPPLSWVCGICGERLEAFSNEGLFTRRNLHEHVHQLEAIIAGKPVLKLDRDDVKLLRRMKISLAEDIRSEKELAARYKPKPGDNKSLGF